MAKKRIGEVSISVVPELKTGKAQKELDKLTQPKEVEIIPKINTKNVFDKMQKMLDKPAHTIKDALDFKGMADEMQQYINGTKKSVDKSLSDSLQATLDDFADRFASLTFADNNKKAIQGYQEAAKYGEKLLETSKEQEKVVESVTKKTKMKTRSLEQVSKELQKEKDHLQEIEKQQTKNELALDRLTKKQANYGKEVFNSNKAVYDVDKINHAANALRNFNTQLEKRNQFAEKYSDLKKIIVQDFVGQYGIDNGLSGTIEDFIAQNPQMKQLNGLAVNGIKGVPTKEINQLFAGVINGLRSDVEMTKKLIATGEILGASIAKELNEEEVKLGEERQRLYNEREAQLNRIATLHQEEMELIVQKGQLEAKVAKQTEKNQEKLIKAKKKSQKEETTPVNAPQTTQSGADLLNEILDNQEEQEKRHRAEQKALEARVRRQADEAAAAYKGRGQEYAGDVYHASRKSLHEVTYDPSVGMGRRTLGQALYTSPFLEQVKDYGENIVRKSVHLKNVFTLIEGGISDITALYLAMGRTAPEVVDWNKAIADLEAFMETPYGVEDFTKRMKLMGYDAMMSLGYGAQGKNSPTQLAIYDEQYWQNLSTVPYDQIKQSLLRYFATPSGQLSMFEGMSDPIREATEEANNLGDTLERVAKIPGQMEIDFDAVKNQMRESANVLTLPELTLEEHQSTVTDGALSGLLKRYNITGQADVKEISDLFVQAMQVSKLLSNSSDISQAEAASKKLGDVTEQIINSITKFGKIPSGKSLDELKSFYEYMNPVVNGKVKPVKIFYNEHSRAEIGDDWAKTKQRFAKHLTPDPTYKSVDNLWGELVDLFPSLFSRQVDQEQNQFREFVRVLDMARIARQDNFTDYIKLSSQDASLMESVPEAVNELLGQQADILDNIISKNQQVVRLEQQREQIVDKHNGVINDEGEQQSQEPIKIFGKDDRQKAIDLIRESENRVGTEYFKNIADEADMLERLTDFTNKLMKQDDYEFKGLSVQGNQGIVDLHRTNNNIRETLHFVYELNGEMLTLNENTVRYQTTAVKAFGTVQKDMLQSFDKYVKANPIEYLPEHLKKSLQEIESELGKAESSEALYAWQEKFWAFQDRANEEFKSDNLINAVAKNEDLLQRAKKNLTDTFKATKIDPNAIDTTTELGKKQDEIYNKFIAVGSAAEKASKDIRHASAQNVQNILQEADALSKTMQLYKEEREKVTYTQDSPEVRSAQIAVRDLKANLGGLKYDGLGKLDKLLEKIKDTSSLEAFTQELNLAKKSVAVLKKEAANGSKALNDASRAVEQMRNASINIKKHRTDLQLLGDVEGTKKANYALIAMEKAAQKFKGATTEQETMESYSVYKRAKSAYDAQYSYAQSQKRLADAEDKMAKAKEQAQKAEEQRVNSLISLQDDLYKAKLRVYELDMDESAKRPDKQRAQRQLNEIQEKYNAGIKLLETEQAFVDILHREDILQEELKNSVEDRLNAQADSRNNAELAEEAKIARQTALEIQQYNQSLEQEEQEKLRIQNEQIANFNKLLELQKKYNEADEKWYRADATGKDKYKYEQDLSKYNKEIQMLRASEKFTQEQQDEFFRIRDEHQNRMQYLFGAQAGEFATKKTSKVADFSRWESNIKNIGILSDETKQKIQDMKDALSKVDDLPGLSKWVEQFAEFKKEVGFETTGKPTKTRLNETKDSLKAQKAELQALYKQLDFDAQLDDNAPHAETIKNEYTNAINAIERCIKATGELSQDEIAAAAAAGSAIKEKMNLYKAAQDSAEQSRQHEESLTGDSAIKKYYQDLRSIFQQIEQTDANIRSLQQKDKGTGMFAVPLANLEMEKEQLVAKAKAISDEISVAFKDLWIFGDKVDMPFSSILSLMGDDTSNTIKNFFNDLRVQESLGKSIDDFVLSLQNAQNKAEEFAVTIKVKFDEILQSALTLRNLEIAGFVSKDNLQYQGALRQGQNLEQIKQQLPKDPTAWTSEQTIAFLQAANAYNKYVSTLEQGATKEANYFANRKAQYNVASMADYDSNVQRLDQESRATSDARQALEKYIQEFANGEVVIKNFTTSADGINKIEFGVFEQGTNQFRTFTAEIGQFTNRIYVLETSLKNLTSGTAAIEKAYGSVFDMIQRVQQLSFDDKNLNVDEYVQNLQKMLDKLKAVEQEVGSSKDAKSQQRLSDVARSTMEELKLEQKKLQEMQKIQEDIKISDGKVANLGSIDSLTNIQAQMFDKIKLSADNASISNVKFDSTTNQLSYTLKDADGNVQNMVASLSKYNNMVITTEKSSGKLKTKWQNIGEAFGDMFSGVGRYVRYMLQIHDIIRYLRQGFNVMLELDTALTELKKVTDETDETYNRFLHDMSKTGEVVGSTVKDLTTSAADWARLGYDLETAGELAKNTMILMNVSEFENVSEATDTLISAIQAFKNEDTDVGTFSMEIIDMFNTIGNSYAISTSDLAESLTRSSASLVAANNSIEEAIALTTAANTIAQNPEAVGNALKTVSMRIRGVKTELEEAGEDTSGMITNTSKLQAKIEALTNIDGSGGINILTESGDFKSTYQILLEISKVWDKMSDTSQASLLEIIAGKNRGSVVAGIFQNGDILENAYEDALDADGSALKENAEYLDSIQGRVDQFNNAVQTMWMHFLNSDVIKFFVNLGTELVKLMDTIGTFKVILGAFFGYLNIRSRFGKVASFKELAAAIKENTTIIQGAINVDKQQTTSSAQSTAAKQKEASAIRQSTEAKRAEMQASHQEATADFKSVAASQASGNANAYEAQKTKEAASAALMDANASNIERNADIGAATSAAAGSTIAPITKRKLKKQTTKHVYKKVAKNSTISQEAAQGVVVVGSSGGDIASSGIKKLASKITGSAVVKGVGKFLGTAVGSVIGGIIIGALIDGAFKLFDKFHKTAEEIAQEAQEITQEYTTKQQEIDQKLDSLTTSSDLSKYKNLEEEFAELSRGVDDYGNNISLASDEYARYNEIVSTILGISPSLIDGYNEEGVAIANKNGLLQQSIALMKEEQRLRAQEFVSDENFVTLGTAAVQEIKDYQNANPLPYGDTKYDFMRAFANAANEYDVRNKFQGNYDLFEALGFEGYDWSDYSGTAADSSYAMIFASDFFEQIVEDLRSEDSVLSQYFTELEIIELNELARQYELAMMDYETRMEQLGKSFNPTLQIVPTTLSSYEALDDQMRGFLSQYINTFEITKDTTEEQLLAMKDDIIQFTNWLANNTDAQDLVRRGSLIKLGIDEDNKSLSVQEYNKQLEEFLGDIEASGFTDEQRNFIFSMLGFDVDTQQFDTDVEKAIAHAKNLLSDEYDSLVDNMSISDVLYIYYKISADPNSLTIEELNQRVADSRKNDGSDVIPVQTYSVASEKINQYNEAVEKTSEIVANNTEVTQEYKDSLIALGISQDELNEYFYEGNDLVVKDAEGLNALVDSAKENTRANIKLAKSQAQLDYYELYKQMNKLVDGNDNVTETIENQVNAMYDQMSVLSATIAQYSLLEAELMGATNAYKELDKARQMDETADYSDDAEELATELFTAFHDGTYGTNVAQVAFEGFIPENIKQEAESLEDYVNDAWSYVTTGPLSKMFTVELDDDGALQSVKITEKNAKAMFEQFKDLGVVEGEWGNFWLDDSITSMGQLTEATGMTEEALVALLSVWEKYDGSWFYGDRGSMFDKLMQGDLNYAIYDHIQALAELDQQYANNTLEYREYMEARTNLEPQQEALEDQAIGNILAYGTVSDELEAANKEIEEIEGRLAGYYKGEDGEWYSAEGIKITDPTAINEDLDRLTALNARVEELYGKLEGLDKIDQIQLQFADDAIDEKIEEYKKAHFSGKQLKLVQEIQNNGWESIEGLERGADGQWMVSEDLVLEYHLEPESAGKLYTFLDLLETDRYIEVMMGEGVPDTAETLQGIATTLQAIMLLLAEGFGIKLDAGDALSVVQQFNDKLSQIPTNKDVTITETIVQKVQSFSNSVNDMFSKIFGGGKVNGTANVNGTAYKNGSWGAPKTEIALTGELGPEMIVRGDKWFTVGDNGAEFANIKRGDIIFNHKQTRELLSNGHVTGRGKAYLSGTAYTNARGSDVGSSSKKTYKGFGDILKDALSTTVKLATTAANNEIKQQQNKPELAEINTAPKKDLSKYPGSSPKTGSGSGGSGGGGGSGSNDFEEVFDWIEVLIEEINDDIELHNARLENAIGSVAQNKVIDSIIDLNEKLYDNLLAGASEYYSYANKLLEKVPAAYREAAQDGKIAIEEFAGSADEATLEAIQNYREWVQKGDDLTQQAEEVLTEISNLAKQAIDNIATDYENKMSNITNRIDQLDAYNALTGTTYGSESEKIFSAIIAENNKNLQILQEQRDKMLAELNAQVEAGHLEKYSQNWYDAVNDIAAVDTEIIELTTDINDLQDSINELHWEHFDNLMDRINAVTEEAENLIDILGAKDVVDEDGNWTKEGITSLGLYAQQLEAAEVQVEKYRAEIDYLNKNWKKLGYTEQEYFEKLEELKGAQYDAIKAYNDTKDAIVDLNAERVDAIKEGIQKEIEAYEKLISAKKEELDAEKDLYDFKKGVMNQQKEISDLERKLAALSADNSASARAERARLEAELLEAKASLEETYYDRSISDQQEALDKELEHFQTEKEEEIQGWEEYLEQTELVVSDSLTTIQANTDIVYQTLQAMGQEYSLSITDALTSPWKQGEYALQSYSEKFGLSMSATVEELQKLALAYKEIMGEIEGYGNKVVNTVNSTTSKYQAATKKEPEKQSTTTQPDTSKTQAEEKKTIKVGGKINAKGAMIYDYAGDTSGEIQFFKNDPIYVVLEEKNGYLKVRHHKISSGATGWFKKKDVKAAYADGTISAKNDQLAWIDEFGEELQLVPGQNGRLEYIKKGTGIVPADLTERIMNLAMDPQIMLDQNRPEIKLSPEIHNTEINIDNSVENLVRIEHCDQNTLPDVERIINKALENHTKNLNNALKRYTRG